MSRFKKGDRVRCVETDGTFPKLDMEQEYIVASADAYEVRLEGRGAWSFYPRRFVLAAPAPVLDPFAWDVFALEPTVREATPYGYVDCIVAWSRFCYLAASLPLTVHPDPAPRTVMVELPVDVAVRRARRVTNVSSDIKAIRNACRAALEATYEP